MLKDDKQVNEKVKGIKDAQDRKEISISYFNSVNSAIALIAPMVKDLTVDQIKASIVLYRDWFLEEHREHRLKALAELSANIVEAGTAIERLEKATDLVNLKAIWVTLTEDERRNETIKDVCRKIRAKYENVH